MNDKRKLASLIIAAVLATVCFAGCVTTPSGKRVVDPAPIETLAPALTASVAGAVVYAYTQNSNSIAYIDVIKTVVQEVALSSDMSAATLQAKIYGLPLKELKTPEAQLTLTPILAAYKAYGDRYVKAGIAENEGLKLLLEAIVSGIDEGLAGVRRIQSGS